MYDNGRNTEVYGLIWIPMDDIGLYPWLILRPIHECVTWYMKVDISAFNKIFGMLNCNSMKNEMINFIILLAKY